jgi:hypothetical protein
VQNTWLHLVLAFQEAVSVCVNCVSNAVGRRNRRQKPVVLDI